MRCFIKPILFLAVPFILLTTYAKGAEVVLYSVGAHDGSLYESGEESGVGGSLYVDGTGGSALRAGDTADKQQTMAIVSFDTSQIPAGVTIVSAKLRLKCGNISGTNPFSGWGGACQVDISSGGFNGNTALEIADFEAEASESNVAQMSSVSAVNEWSEGTLTSGLSNINRTGYTQFRVGFAVDNNNNGAVDHVGWYSGENGTADNRPQLVIEYTPVPLEPTDPNAIPEVHELFHYIDGLKWRTANRVLSGQNVDNYIGNYDDVYKRCYTQHGYWPAIMQSQICYPWTDRTSIRHHANVSWLYPLFYNHYKRGGVCMLTLNPYNPFLGSSINSKIPEGRSAAELLTPGTPANLAYRVFREDIALNAKCLKRLENAGVPVIVRIFGEYTLSGFWFHPNGYPTSDQRMTFPQLKQLFQVAWDVFVNKNDVHNLLFMTEVCESSGHYMDLYDENYVDIPGTKFRWWTNDPVGEYPAHEAITAGCDKPILIGQANIKNTTTPNTFDMLNVVETFENNPEAVGGALWWNVTSGSTTNYMAIVDQKNVVPFFQHPTIIDRTETPWCMSNPPPAVPWDLTLPETAQVADVAFNFNGASTQGWAGQSNISNINASDNRLNVFYYGEGPTLLSPDGMNIDAAAVSRFAIRMRNDSLSQRIILQWQRTTDSGFSDARSIELAVNECDDQFTEYCADLSGHPEWNGTIKRARLRLAPDNVWGSSEIDYILFKEGPPATVLGATVNGGGDQRSRVESLQLDFSSTANIDSGAFQLINTSSSQPVTVTLSTQVISGKTVATLTFTGSEMENGSLKDGRYQLTVYGNKVHDAATGADLDGDNNGTTGGNHVFGAADADNFFRYFGDYDGDYDVDGIDFSYFRTTMNKSSANPGFLWCFDFDNDGDVDGIDFAYFRNHMNKTLP
jgi:hypothetical protein